MEEKYVMFSMEDIRIKELSEALSNPTCKRIINLLSEKDLTETEISSELKLAANTINYNIKKLVSVGLIEKVNHFWSTRGKKMPVYRVSNKKIIISPKKPLPIKNLFISMFGTGILALLVQGFLSGGGRETERISNEMLYRSLDVASSSIQTSTAGLFASWQWFLFGAWLGIIFFFLAITLGERRSKNGKI